jgi:hypothetical protein
MKRTDFSPNPKIALKEIHAHIRARTAHRHSILDSSMSMDDKFAALLEPDKLYLDERHYDYDNQAWVVNGRYKSCAHPGAMNCQCYGRLHQGELEVKP